MRLPALVLRSADDVRAVIAELDTWARSLGSIVNGGVSLRDQLSGEVKSIRYVGGSELTVSTRVSSMPAAVLVLSARESRNAAAATMSGNRISWSYRDGVISITAIDGLTASTDYLVSLAVVEA
jgi:hypothetical protein